MNGKKSGGFGRLIVFATVAGAVAAGISYFTKYKSFHKELEEDFHDFEDDGDISSIDSTMNRNYVTIRADKDELTVAANDMADAAKDMANAAKNMAKDAAEIVSDTAKDAAAVAAEKAKHAMNYIKNKAETTSDMNKHSGKESKNPEKEILKETTTIIEEDSDTELS